MVPQLGRKRYQTPSRDLDLGAVHHCKIRHIHHTPYSMEYLFGLPLALLAIVGFAGFLLGNKFMTRDGLVSDVGLFRPMVNFPFELSSSRSSTSGILQPTATLLMPCLDCLCPDNASACRTFLQPYITHFLKPDLGEPILWSGQPLKLVRFIAITYQKNSRDTIDLARYIQVLELPGSVRDSGAFRYPLLSYSSHRLSLMKSDRPGRMPK